MMLLVLILSLFSSVYVSGEIRITLNSGNFSGVWTVHNDSSSEKIEAHVPGGIYSDLNLIEDLLYRQNDIAYRWVAFENWTYETTFELPEEILNKTAINLVFHGIDTIGDVYLNGEFVQSVNNMFVRYVIPIKDIAKETNVLEVRLKSPVIAAQELAEAEGYDLIMNCPEHRVHGECHIHFLRKMQASFGWDFGPAFPSVGIWKPVEIEAFDLLLIRDVVGLARKVDDNYFVDAFCYFESTKDFQNLTDYFLTTTLRWTNPDLPNITKTIARAQSLKRDFSLNSYNWVHNVTFDLTDSFFIPKYLWWPNSHGEQWFGVWSVECMYESLALDSDNETILILEAVKEVNIGIRSIELVQEEITPGEEGLSYNFKVNGVPVFVKGTNWIPGHILPELAYDEKMLRSTLQSVKDANMNMIRVWGGGIYESDLFYDICDELGIMVWQDMMFSDTLYPSNEKYLESVATEVEQQIRRLARHPSIAVWSGNDENELIMSIIKYWGITPANTTEQYVSDYLKLYVETIKPIIEQHDSSRPYALSSPSSGVKSIQQEYIAEDPMSPLYGTGVYTPINDIKNTTTLANSRFFSKFGYASMPSFKTISNVSLPDDWSLQSEFSVSREHESHLYDRITSLIQFLLPLPEDDGSVEFFKTYIYYSQILQAVGTQLASETYRVDRDRLKAGNEGKTSGILLWHLNDVWQGPTWSSIEFGGRWKMLHYYAAKFFAPLTVVPQLTSNGTLQVYVVSDLLEDVSYNINITFYSWGDFNYKSRQSLSGEAINSKSDLVNELEYADTFNALDCNETSCFIHFHLEAGNYTSENIFYPSSFANVTNLKPANIAVNVTKGENSNNVLIDLTTDAIAPFVWLETDEKGIFSDNGFTLVTEYKQLQFNSTSEEIDIENFKNTLIVRSLLN